jgi:hypothetical protein
MVDDINTLKIIKAILDQIQTFQQELKYIMLDQAKQKQYVLNLVSKIPNILDDIIEKQNLVTNQIMKNIEERYAFTINNESSVLKGFKIAEAWLIQFFIEILSMTTKWTKPEIENYMMNRIKIIERDRLYNTYSFDEKIQHIINEIEIYQKELKMNNFGGVLILSVAIVFHCTIYSKRFVDIPYIDGIWKELMSKL